MRTIVTAVMMAGAVACAGLCQDGDFSWTGQLQPGQLLEIRGISGAIRAQGGSDGTATVTAHKSATMSDIASVKIQVTPFEGGVVICAIYPIGKSGKANTCNAPGMDSYLSSENNDVQVDFTVQVPQGVRFTASASHGEIQANSVTADVQANTVLGNITISTTGAAEARTSDGSISATIGRVDWSGARDFSAVRGNVDLQIPADANVSVRASTVRGTLTSDFPLMIRTFPWGSTAIASGVLGSDGRSLRITTSDGNITLRQGPASNQ